MQLGRKQPENFVKSTGAAVQVPIREDNAVRIFAHRSGLRATVGPYGVNRKHCDCRTAEYGQGEFVRGLASGVAEINLVCESGWDAR